MFLLIDKPSWYTSYDLIHKIKKLFPKKTKIWHAGTLDPMATGLMLIAIGRDTKKLSQFVWLNKSYIATIDFSKKSDTRDMDYRACFEQLELDALTAPSLESITTLLDTKLGTSQRPLTPFSAKKVRWKKLYEYARAGEPIYIDIDMELLSYEIISYEFPTLQVRISVWSGTYIRSIAHWIWEQLGMGGILTALHRESIWSHSLPTARIS